VLALAGCTAAADSDGEVLPSGRLAPPQPGSPDAVDVVVDTDLAPDDLVALAYLMRHPDVRVRAVTVPATGLVACPVGADVARDLMDAVGVERVPVSCGETPRGRHGTPFPASWSMAALDSGFERDSVSTTRSHPLRPPALVARLARRHPGLEVVALGPLTELAALLREDPASYARLGRVVAMAGVVDGPPQDDRAGEWNAAADPDALARVLDGPVPVTLVPHEVVPPGSPDGMRAPVVGGIGVLTPLPAPRFWDLATAAWSTLPGAGTTASGTWSVAQVGEPGRLTRTGAGDDLVVTGLDAAALDEAYRRVFAAAG